jgi:hypothetical protein
MGKRRASPGVLVVQSKEMEEINIGGFAVFVWFKEMECLVNSTELLAFWWALFPTLKPELEKNKWARFRARCEVVEVEYVRDVTDESTLPLCCFFPLVGIFQFVQDVNALPRPEQCNLSKLLALATRSEATHIAPTVSAVSGRPKKGGKEHTRDTRKLKDIIQKQNAANHDEGSFLKLVREAGVFTQSNVKGQQEMTLATDFFLQILHVDGGVSAEKMPLVIGAVITLCIGYPLLLDRVGHDFA